VGFIGGCSTPEADYCCVGEMSHLVGVLDVELELGLDTIDVDAGEMEGLLLLLPNDLIPSVIASPISINRKRVGWRENLAAQLSIESMTRLAANLECPDGKFSQRGAVLEVGPRPNQSWRRLFGERSLRSRIAAVHDGTMSVICLEKKGRCVGDRFDDWVDSL
jgi:hypothetical protein